jgi:hypothetical protein
MSILLLTRTLWSEPPRLRHQVAQLLLGAGQTVLFAERPALLGTPAFIAHQHVRTRSEQLLLLPQQDLVHHQLRLVPALHHLNAAWARTALQRVLAQRTANGSLKVEQVINFNYDAFWLRRLFPSLPITTIINDDFEALSRLPFHGHLTWALARTCAMSDRVFAVSNSLCDRLSTWCSPELFLPWASRSYIPPSIEYQRNVLLYWGYINNRLDCAAIADALPSLQAAGFRLRFVGPIETGSGELRRQLLKHPAVEWLPACKLEALDTRDCIAAMLPYRLDFAPNLAAQLPNKALQLLSRGLPLVASDLPHLHTAPYIFKYGTSTFPGLIDALRSAAQHVHALQPAIAAFVAANGPQQRLAQLLGSVAAS